jgi:hypothetical protein
VTQPHEFRLHVCPLCAAPVEVEDGGYDGPYYTWSCDHKAVLPYPQDQPARMTLAAYMDPVRREYLRSIATAMVWERMHEACEARRKVADAVDYEARYRDHPVKLPLWPQYRRQRHEWRQRSRTSQVSEVLKRVYSEPLREHLQQHNLLFSVQMQDEVDGLVHDIRRDLARQTYGDTFLIPLKREDP